MYTGIRPVVATVVEVVGVVDFFVVELFAAGVVTILFICRVGVSGTAVCTHVHTCIHIHTHIPKHIYLHAYITIHTCTHTHAHTYMHIYAYKNKNVVDISIRQNFCIFTKGVFE